MGTFPWETGKKHGVLAASAQRTFSRRVHPEPRPFWPVWKVCPRSRPGTASFSPVGAYGGLNRQIRTVSARSNGQ